MMDEKPPTPDYKPAISVGLSLIFNLYLSYAYRVYSKQSKFDCTVSACASLFTFAFIIVLKVLKVIKLKYFQLRSIRNLSLLHSISIFSSYIANHFNRVCSNSCYYCLNFFILVRCI